MRIKLCFIWVVPALFACGLRGQDPIVAKYEGGSLRQSEYQTWSQLMADGTDKDRMTVLQEVVLQKYLADFAEAQKLVEPVTLDTMTTHALGRWVMSQMRQHLDKTTKVPPAEIEETLALSRKNQHRPRKVRLKNIFKRFPQGMTSPQKEELKTRLLQIREKLKQGADFAKMAMAESDSQTRFNKGVLGNVKQGQLHPTVDAVAMAMEPGSYSDPIETEDGFTLLFCEKIIPAQQRSEEDFRKSISKTLHRHRVERAWEKARKALVDPAAITYHWQVLRQQPLNGNQVVATYQNDKLQVAGYRALLKKGGIPKGGRLPQRPKMVREFFLKKRALTQWITPGGVKAALPTRRAFYRSQVLAAEAGVHLIQKRLVPPSEAEMQRLFAARKDRFVEPAQYRCQVLQYPFKSKDMVAASKFMERLEAQLEAGQLTFEQAITKHSNHASKEQKGHLAWMTDRELSRIGINLLRAARALQPGEMSGYIKDGESYWLVRLIEFRPKRSSTYEEAKPRMEQFLGQMRVAETEQQVIREILTKLNVQPTPEF